MTIGQSIGSLNGPAVLNTVDNLTATAGGGQSGALLLTAYFNRVTTVASGNDSVRLPQSTVSPYQVGSVGCQIYVHNSGANSMQLFGSGTDTINGVATGTGVAVPAGKQACLTLLSISAGVGSWYMLLSA